MQQSPQPLSPQFFQSLKIENLELGSGHDSKVLLGTNQQGEQFALKCQAQKIKDTAINLFLPRMKSKFSSTSITTPIFEDCTCLVLQYCPNGTLTKLIQKSPLPVSVAAALLNQITLTLSFMHSKGFTHGDLKLSNIVIDKDFSLKLCDFGFARWNGKMAIEKQTIAGSEGYTAPELWKKNPDYVKCDMFSVAIIFFILITGHPPFESNNPDNNDPWWDLIKNSQWDIFWREIRSNIDDDCKQLFVKMFHINPQERLSAEQLNQWCQLKQSSHEITVQEVKARITLGH